MIGRIRTQTAETSQFLVDWMEHRTGIVTMTRALSLRARSQTRRLALHSGQRGAVHDNVAVFDGHPAALLLRADHGRRVELRRLHHDRRVLRTAHPRHPLLVGELPDGVYRVAHGPGVLLGRLQGAAGAQLGGRRDPAPARDRALLHRVPPQVGPGRFLGLRGGDEDRLLLAVRGGVRDPLPPGRGRRGTGDALPLFRHPRLAAPRHDSARLSARTSICSGATGCSAASSSTRTGSRSCTNDSASKSTPATRRTRTKGSPTSAAATARTGKATKETVSNSFYREDWRTAGTIAVRDMIQRRGVEGVRSGDWQGQTG